MSDRQTDRQIQRDKDETVSSFLSLHFHVSPEIRFFRSQILVFRFEFLHLRFQSGEFVGPHDRFRFRRFQALQFLLQPFDSRLFLLVGLLKIRFEAQSIIFKTLAR